MKLEGAFLGSKVGRRIFVMFGLAVTIPAIAVFSLTYQHATALASKNEAATLRALNKGFALTVFERLQLARSTLERTPSYELRGAAVGPIFTEVVERDPPGVNGQRDSTSNSGSRLLLLREGAEPPRVAILSRNEAGRRMLGTLDSRFIWGDPEAVISDGQICVQSGGVNLTCVGTAPVDPPRQLLRDEWDLFLAPEFGVPSWRFVAIKPRGGSFKEYAALFLPVAVGMLLLALLLSSIEIRRILVPLEALLKRISSIGGGQATTIPTSSNEFSTLDRTFQDMESRINRQISVLKTLQEVDQLILERVPLTNVIDVVTERVRTIVGARPVAISVITSSGNLSDRHFMRYPDGSVAVGSLPIDDPIAEGAYQQKRTREWQVAVAVGPSFAKFDLAAVWYFTIGQEGGPFVRMSLGQLGSEVGQNLPNRYDEHGELEELVDRVAVALATEVHERRLVHQARHDLLTNLPNRLAVLEVLPSVIKQAQELSHGFATLFVDLDRFKAINDGLGHALGDTVLVEVARRIRATAGVESFVARLGGDEFLVIAPRAGNGAAALSIDNAIREALKEPILVESRSLFIDFTAGIAIYPEDGGDPETLMHNADVAMYRAKRSGGGHALLFDSEMNRAATRRVQMENDLRVAVTANQLQLHYQPRVDSRDGSVVGAEALVRWAHPTWGCIGPNDFIGLAEECGLIGDIGAFVINSACKQMAVWQSAGFSLPLIAINISTNQLRAGDLYDTISDALAENGLDWRQLEIEITESVLVKDAIFASEQLQRLRDSGSTVAIDDFGTGYSSLVYLTSLPTDTIKIDRGFFHDLHTSGTQAVVRSIIALGQTLGQTIVAEGVETLEDVALLNSWGCHIVQAYVYSPPLTPESMTDLLQASQS